MINQEEELIEPRKIKKNELANQSKGKKKLLQLKGNKTRKKTKKINVIKNVGTKIKKEY